MSLNFCSLAQFPQRQAEFIQLVEKSFVYTDDHSFSVDFYPLVNTNNFENCFMLLENNIIKATCAFKIRQIQLETKHTIALMGAIAVDENFRQKGLGLEIVKQTMNKIPPVSWFGLWSEKINFFSKLNFYSYAEQYFIPRKTLAPPTPDLKYKKTILSQLNENQIVAWKNYYQQLQKFSNALDRSDKDWGEILQITSANYLEIYFKEKQIGYAVVDKGMDLKNIVHEYYVDAVFTIKALELLNKDFEIWLPCFDLKLSLDLVGHNLLIAEGEEKLWKKWEQEYKTSLQQKKHLLISGLDSV